MKRNILTILLACLMIVSLLALGGCKVNDLAIKVDENANKVDADVKAAAKKAADDLAAAKTELETLIANGDAAGTAAIAAAVENLNAAINTAKEALAGADAALKTELTELVNSCVATLNASIKKVADDLAAATADLNAAILAGDTAVLAELTTDIEELTTVLTVADAALETKLTSAVADSIAALKTELTAAIELAAQTAADNLADTKAELEAAILAGDTAVLAELTADIEELITVLTVADAALELKLTSAIADSIAALKTELTAAIELVAQTAAKNLADTEAELEAAIIAGDATVLAELTTDIEELTTVLTVADAALEMKLTSAIADSIAALKTELTAAIADVQTKLTAAIEALADDLAEATDLLNALIVTNSADIAVLEAARDALEDDVTALEAAIDALGGDTEADFSGLKAYIDEQIAEAKAAADVAYVVIENWNVATEKVIDAVVEIATNFNTELKAAYYYDEEYAIIVALYEEFKIRLTRAVDEDAVEAVLYDVEDGYYAAIGAVDTKADVIYDILTAHGTEVEEVLLNDDWYKAITNALALLAAETDADAIELLENVQDLADEMYNRYQVLLVAKTEADAINARVDALIAAIDANGYTAANKAEYESIIADIATWDETYGTANAALINREKVETMKTDYEAAIDTYEAAAQALLDKFATYNAAEYVFVYTLADYTAVIEFKAEYDAWALDVADRGFALDGAVEAPVYAAYETFAAGAYARAIALNTANAEADAIEAEIQDLTEKLNNFTVVRSAYQTKLQEIKADVKVWIETYFAAPYDTIDGAEKANYELLDHAAVAAVEKLYNDTMAEIMQLAENLKAALAEIKTIDVYSGADIEAASTAYTAFTNWLADLSYEIEGLADTATITNSLAAKTVEFKNLVADVITDYNALTVLKASDVLLTSATDIDALKTWFNDYFGIDITVADAALPEGVEKVVLNNGSEELTVDATTVANAVAAVKAFNDLTDAKADEFDALKEEIDALLAENASTALREAINTALTNYAEWLDGSNVLAGFEKTQFIPVDATALDAEKAGLDTLNTGVEALEAAYKALQGRIADLELDYEAITDILAAKTILETLFDDIDAFIVSNDGYDCFTDAEYQTIEDAKTAIDQAGAYAAILEDYNDLIADLAAVVDTRVVENMTARANEALEEAKAAIEAVDEDGLDLAFANFTLLTATIDKYVESLAAAVGNATKEAKVYEAYVILDNRDDMVDDAQLTDELTIVKETFEAVLVD